MKRVALSIAGGAGVVAVVASCIALAAPGRLRAALAWMLAFPLPFFSALLPRAPEPDDLFPGSPSAAALLATLLFDLAFYSLLVYLFLRRRGRVGRLPPPGVSLSVER